ncbi:unnamed protein product [Mytilus coruscus]|uniref:G-protein coupled receptors family 1 profile domain-containing protein n=1 Tax=Mytilus coruscus TaxID=42192 RepID=A0A6J8AII0_MYTCO|nr:unnamed protein product [Mytilus coruscus]
MCGCYIFLVWFLLLSYASTTILFTTNKSDLLTSDNDFDVPNVTVYPEIPQRGLDYDDDAITSSRYGDTEVMKLKGVLQNNSNLSNKDTTRMLSDRRNTTCEQGNTSYIDRVENCSINSNILDSTDSKDRLTSLKNTIADTNKAFMYFLPFIYIPGLILGFFTGLRINLKENRKNKASFSMTYFLITICVSLVLSLVKYIVYNISVFFKTSVWLNIGRWVVLIIYYHLGKIINWMVISQYATVAINKFVSTAFPFYVRRFPLALNPKRVTIVLLTIYLLFGFVNVPRQTVMVTRDEIKGVGYIPVNTDIGNRHKKLLDLYGFLTTVLLTMIPIILTTVFYLLTIAALIRSRKRAPVSDKIQRSKERITRRLTKIFVALIAIKLITTFPCLLFVMINGFTFTAEDNESSMLSLFVFNVVQYVGDITHGISSVIIIFMSSSFRKELYRIFTVVGKQRKQTQQDQRKRLNRIEENRLNRISEKKKKLNRIGENRL